MKKIILPLIFTLSCAHKSTSKYDHYKNFAELEEHHQVNQDYKIEIKHGKTPVLIMAIHGCKIEEGTSELAEIVSSHDHNYYNFCGMKTTGIENKMLLDSLLHITSTHFDEPSLIELTKKSDVCISLHGYPGDKADFCLGGRDERLRKNILEKLQKDFPEFTSCDLCCPPYLGLAHKNPVNRCKYQGVQIEMSPKVRRSILENSSIKQRLSILLRGALIK